MSSAGHQRSTARGELCWPLPCVKGFLSSQIGYLQVSNCSWGTVNKIIW